MPKRACGGQRPFGAWLLAQQARGGAIGALADLARADPGFPRVATPDQVRDHVEAGGADSDILATVDQAESAWRARADAA